MAIRTTVLGCQQNLPHCVASIADSSGHREGRANLLLFADHPVSVPIPHPAVGGMTLRDRRDPVTPCLGTGDPSVSVVVPQRQGIHIALLRHRRGYGWHGDGAAFYGRHVGGGAASQNPVHHCGLDTVAGQAVPAADFQGPCRKPAGV